MRALLSESEALWLVPDSTVLTDESIRFILESALAKQVPVFGFSSELTRLGALLSMSIDYGEVGREAGLLARRILNGEHRCGSNRSQSSESESPSTKRPRGIWASRFLKNSTA